MFARLALRMGLDDPLFRMTDEEAIRDLVLDWSHPALEGVAFRHAARDRLGAAEHPAAVAGCRTSRRRRLPDAIRQVRAVLVPR